jgi:hypothetical protein
MKGGDIWNKFKQDNKLLMKEFDVTMDKFKQFVKTKMSLSNIILKNKNANSAFEIKCIKWKQTNIPLEPPKMEIILNIDSKTKKS